MVRGEGRAKSLRIQDCIFMASSNGRSVNHPLPGHGQKTGGCLVACGTNVVLRATGGAHQARAGRRTLADVPGRVPGGTCAAAAKAHRPPEGVSMGRQGLVASEWRMERATTPSLAAF